MDGTLYFNAGAFIHAVRQGNESEFYLEGKDTSIFEPYNPMNLRFREVVPCYEEHEYGVNDLYVLEDKYGIRWGAKMYRGLGKHDENYQIMEIADEVVEAIDDEDARFGLAMYPLELFEVVRKATYTYEVV